MHRLARLLRRRSYVLGTATLLCIAVALTASSFGRSASTGAPVSVAGIRPILVSAEGFDLTQAQSTSPASVGQEAAATASQAYGGRSVVDEQYAHCQTEGQAPAVSQDCWVVALDTTGMMTNPPAGIGVQPQQLTFFYVLVDPTTGSILAAGGGTGT